MDIAEIVKILQRGDFDKLINLIEGEQIEAKGSPYQLLNDSQKQELAKDVSALGNAAGGIVLIGFETKKDSLSAVERISAYHSFDQAIVDLIQYRNVLQAWIYPPIHSVSVEWYPSMADNTKGTVAIIVPSEAVDEKPYLVKHTVQPDGKVSGTLIGYYERVLDRIPATSPERLRTWLRDGMRFDELSQRLATIEQFIANLSLAPSVPQTGLTDEDIGKRIAEAQKAVERTSEPVIILAAISEDHSGFPQLFRSQSEPVVQLLDKPPQFRSDGFGVGLRLSRPSEIVGGELRRRLGTGSQIIDLWQDGLLLGIGEGDYDLLCWFMRYPGNPTIQEQSLLIRNFVLAEVTLNFLQLGIEVFKHAEPPPKKIKFMLCLDNMTVNDLPCELSSVPDRTSTVHFQPDFKAAPGPKISSEFALPFDELDIGRIAYKLLAGLYVKFGFHESDVPYVQDNGDGKKITAASLKLLD